MLQEPKTEEWSFLSSLTSDMALRFDLMDSSLTVVQYFHTVPRFLPFCMAIYIYIYISCSIMCWKYIIGFFILQDVAFKRSP